MFYRNGTYIRTDMTNINKGSLITSSFVGFWADWDDLLYDCYSLKIPPKKEIEKYEIGLKSLIFPNSIRSTNGGVLTFLHYTNQLILSSKTLKYTWPKRKTYDKFSMIFKIDAVEIIKRRKNGNKACYEDWENYDNFVLLQHLNKVGCRPPYLPATHPFPLCDSREKMRDSKWYMKRDMSDISPPCNAMEKIYYTYEEENLGRSVQDGVFNIVVWFSDQQFKEITLTRSVIS